MPSAKILEAKKALVADLNEKIAGSLAGVVVAYNGISVADDTKLRKELREAGVHYMVVKNTMLRLAVKGTQYASAGADYCYGVNKNTTDDKKLAAELYIKWLSESSNFAFDQGGVPVLKSQQYPDTLKAFDGIDLIEDTPAPAELADLATEVQQEAELMLNADQTHVMRVVEAGINGDETLDDIVADWNAAWDKAVDAYAPQ